MITLREIITEIITRKRAHTPIKLIEYAENTLESLYNSPNRHYHTYAHIQDCLNKYEQVRSSISPYDRDTVALALIYHDCIYDSRYLDNERLSAERAYVDLFALGFYGFHLQRIHNLILQTTHIKPGEDLCSQTIMDIDLSILGESVEVFYDYEKKIRQEFSFYSTEEYLRGRTTFLKNMLGRNTIYQTEYFINKYENSARSNIEGLIKELPKLYSDEPIQVTENRYYLKDNVEIHCYKCAFESDCMYREYSAACHRSFLPTQGKIRDVK